MNQLRRLSFAILLAGLVLATAGVAGAAPAVAPKNGKARMTWSVGRIVRSLAAGESVVVPVTLTSTADVSGVRLQPSGGLGRITGLEPSGPFDLKAGVPFPVKVTLTMPAEGAHTHAGVIMVRAGRRNLPASLKVLVQLPGATDIEDEDGGKDNSQKPAKPAKPAKNK